MQTTTFIEENLTHEQIVALCKILASQTCQSLEFRRCTIASSDFDELMNNLSIGAISIISLIFNVQMFDEQTRFMKFIQTLSKCSNLINLQLHGNGIDDNMFSQLCSVLHKNCPKLIVLDVGDNKLTNKAIVSLCSLIVIDEKTAGLEELCLTANRAITTAGWTELFFALSYASRLRRLALDYNPLDNTTVAMLSMVVASSRTLACLDLECCNLSEYAAQLFLALLTKYPVRLDELCLNKNPAILDSTRELINECLNLKSRRNSTAALVSTVQQTPPPPVSPLPLTSPHPPPVDEDSTSTSTSTIVPVVKTSKIKKKKKRSNVKETPKIVTRELPKVEVPVSSTVDEQPVEVEEEELLPVEIDPYGTVTPMLHWYRI